MSGVTARAGAGLRELAGALGVLLAVLGGAAALLWLLDGVPARLMGESRRVRVVASVVEASRRLRADLVLPAYFPDTLAWPPSRVRVTGGDVPGASLTIEGRDAPGTRLVIVQSAFPGPIPPVLAPQGTALGGGSPVNLGAATGTLRRVIGPDGEIWWDLAWTVHGRSVVMRWRGELDELIRMAHSARVSP